MVYLPITSQRQVQAAQKRKTGEIISLPMNLDTFPTAVNETGSLITITADLHGLDYADASVKLHNSRIVIDVALRAGAGKDPSHLVFARHEFPLFTPVETEAAVITLRQDVLRITLPKKASRSSRRWSNYL